MNRTAFHDALAAIIDFGKVVASSLSSSAKSLLATIEGASGGGTAERVEGQQVWGHAAILWRPRVDTEVLFVRSGDELLTLASRETRWQVELSEGDVCVRNLSGTKPVRLWLKADGTAVLEADEVKLGDSGATEAIALGTTLKSHLDSLKSYIDGHTHGYVDDSAGPQLTSAPVSFYAVPPGTPAPSPSVPDVESKHKVES